MHRPQRDIVVKHLLVVVQHLADVIWDPCGARPNDLSRNGVRARKALGWPAIIFHGLRHTSALLLIASGMHVVAVSKRLGHKSPTTTSRVHGHLFARLRKDAAAADAINKVMRGCTVV